MPKSVQSEFKTVLRIMPFEAYVPGAPGKLLPTVPATDELRRLCLEAIEREYEKI